ncbi:metalloregulator ArsR/SmtB family transcription factor [Marivirga sp. S37H4]|uniref:Metalloregulator ArsR/SmtB family transcription factor n=1 Tax=Marivirga aurantiaca TaxID=2802615 RepID=A0A934X2J1_9BACT|nr:metalloregulator ArsR/SmtB family transcription factor [Marivirga aurantiaca]MBK6267170.1 metalloregulator ArsR/SmtB family transcription factor [Marivirga aurantiaca]
MRLKNFTLNFSVQVFKCLADDSRLRILFQVHENQQMCISDLELILNFTQAKTSRHLLYLKNNGVLNSRKVDQWVFYNVKEEVKDLLSQSFRFVEKDQLLQKDLETFKVMYANRELALNKLHNRKWVI